MAKRVRRSKEKQAAAQTKRRTISAGSLPNPDIALSLRVFADQNGFFLEGDDLTDQQNFLRLAREVGEPWLRQHLVQHRSYLVLRWHRGALNLRQCEAGFRTLKTYLLENGLPDWPFEVGALELSVLPDEVDADGDLTRSKHAGTIEQSTAAMRLGIDTKEKLAFFWAGNPWREPRETRNVYELKDLVPERSKEEPKQQSPALSADATAAEVYEFVHAVLPSNVRDEYLHKVAAELHAAIAVPATSSTDAALAVVHNLSADEQHVFRQKLLESEATRESASESLQSVQQRQRAELLTVTKERIFGQAAPSLKGFQAYLKRLHASSKLRTSEDKKEVCTAVNSWKKELKAEFVFDDTVCSLEVVPDDGQGTFRLRATSVDPKTGTRANLYSESKFPRNLVCRRRRG